eukprot:CAMPEP_0117066362 /NCGR_PEP_ID=MMETSP0472-20121206/46414_1 /TAXON_ID=693140 ORGANISM="Tiarina fusus, Strain LIS" /NCGR_SAMPLE_ID=MMETSP0472 /ASSEMBLY_ACC=CAM_ASM_000603 /LENGTH=645 /DNA_ID=CAMNT_0004787399 /DNA_START=125 /DNA_END=2062 /DNA_ORIENTATION=+
MSEENYRCLVVDSGPIIKHAGIRNLFGKADAYITVPGVMDEIRDAKARAHLEQWPMELQVKSPSPESIQSVIAFSKQTGDYASLSKVDLEVLALALDLEREGCNNNLEHIRTSPKRMIGLGSIQSLKNEKDEGKVREADQNESNEEEEEEEQASCAKLLAPESSPNEPTGTASPTASKALGLGNDQDDNETETIKTGPGPKSWAMLVNPAAASTTLPKAGPKIPSMSTTRIQDGGQFSDADETDGEDDGEDNNNNNLTTSHEPQQDVEAELVSEFPSLAVAATVPYEGSDDEEGENHAKIEEERKKNTDERLLLEKKMQALQPISKSGKLYNSFRKYGKLMKPKAATTPQQATNTDDDGDDANKRLHLQSQQNSDDDNTTNQQSKIIGGATMSSQDMGWDEDDGEGWITCKSDIRSVAASGSLGSGPQKNNGDGTRGPVGPPKSSRTACTTTDFAMQNVLLQMGMALLSVDGVQIRRVKSWVHRCGACFKIHTDAEFLGMKRLFCSHCGSDMMQRIAASVDGKTGRLKLHLSKKYKHNLRGTKFSLPKPGSGNRFQGDLLLREDQLLTGAWNQKVKIRTGGQSRANAQSIFGKDLASNVGCETKLVSTDDVRVAFGRRNPNGAKGRERRGKKKKSSDRACGLRRY